MFIYLANESSVCVTNQVKLYCYLKRKETIIWFMTITLIGEKIDFSQCDI